MIELLYLFIAIFIITLVLVLSWELAIKYLISNNKNKRIKKIFGILIFSLTFLLFASFAIICLIVILDLSSSSISHKFVKYIFLLIFGILTTQEKISIFTLIGNYFIRKSQDHKNVVYHSIKAFTITWKSMFYICSVLLIISSTFTEIFDMKYFMNIIDLNLIEINSIIIGIIAFDQAIQALISGKDKIKQIFKEILK